MGACTRKSCSASRGSPDGARCCTTSPRRRGRTRSWRLDPDAGSEQRMLYLEAPSEIEPPKRYRNDYGQLLEHSPYSQRDLHQPDDVAPRSDAGDFVIHVRSTDLVTAYHYRHHPFDL